MDDSRIIDLYWCRDEQAISQTKQKYGEYCFSIAYRILSNREDAEECENDTYLDAWNSIPPHRPSKLSVFLGKITRRISIDRYRHNTAKKRGGDQVTLALDELLDCIPDRMSIDDEIQNHELGKMIDCFLRGLGDEERIIFIRRYFHVYAIKDISKSMGISESKVKTTLLRTRKKLLVHLEREGVFI